MSWPLLLLACADSGPPTLRGPVVGSCDYESPFSGEPECREFYETEVAAAADSCEGVNADLRVDESCPTSGDLGACTYSTDDGWIRTTVYGEDPDKCGSSRFGCETFANGYWEPAALCADDEGLVVLDDPFPLAERVCVDPLPGEPTGLSEGGQVCTWEIVSGATEDGRHFSAYASCAPIIRQRGYTPVPPNDRAADPDPRLDDPAYAAEDAWVKRQLDAGSCECCHSSAVATEGASVFDSAAAGGIANQFNDRGLARAAGWIPTVGFGTFPPEDNNGFERSSPENPYLSIIPTTDQARMMAFFEAELAERGLRREDFEGDTYGAGPLDAQLYYEPERCSPDEGVDADGVIRWAPGRARYIYVLEAGSGNPTVEPNLDTPEGTLWRVDLPADGSPVYSETVRYGEVPSGMVQKLPADGAPAPLVAGREYYLYVTADVLYPISRCLFTAGDPAPAACATGPAGGGLVLAGAAAAFAARRRRR
jgi:MYXO-CTERM domain-containing protein